jgi:hypothetical protein
VTGSVFTAVVLVFTAGAADLPLGLARLAPVAFRPSLVEAGSHFSSAVELRRAAVQFSFFLGLGFVFARTWLSSRFSAREQVRAGRWSHFARRQIFGPGPVIHSASILPLIFAASLG